MSRPPEIVLTGVSVRSHADALDQARRRASRLLGLGAATSIIARQVDYDAGRTLYRVAVLVSRAPRSFAEEDVAHEPDLLQHPPERVVVDVSS